jgi:Holliday junction resolvase RusA-like endonuclease
VAVNATDDQPQTLRFVIPVPPRPKHGAKRTLRGGRVRSYPNPEDQRQELAIRQWVASSLPMGWAPVLGPVQLTYTAFLSPPKSLPKYAVGHVLPITAPDCKNLEWLLEDALNGLVWQDDSQIVDVRGGKRYAWHPQVPGWEVEVTCWPVLQRPQPVVRRSRVNRH